MINNRLCALSNALGAKGVQAFLVTDPLNVFYLSGFKGEGALVVTAEGPGFIVTDSRFREEAAESEGFRTALIKTGIKDALIGILKDQRIKNTGFEADNFSYRNASIFKNALEREQIKFTPLNGIVENMRMLKSGDEIKKIKKAVGIAGKVFSAFVKLIRPGKTEKQLSLELSRLIIDSGADDEAFSPIIASGERSSRPHAVPTSRIIKRNEGVLIDFGVRLDSYNCDLTRVCFLGKIQQQLYNIYTICKEAQRRAIAIMRPGLTAKEADRAARSYIESKGFGNAFGHSLGHGIGLSVHELPRVWAKSETILEPGMVVTVEPGIYIEGARGARIEDMVLVTKKGCEVLTDDIPK